MDTVRIPLSSRKFPGMVAFVDAADAPLVEGRRWYLKTSRTAGLFYAFAWDRSDGKARQRRVWMHRLILGDVPAAMVTDHINGDGLDNRRANLRVATPSENAFNKRIHREGSASLGVHFRRDIKKWQAYAQDPETGKKVHLGNYPDRGDAVAVRQAAVVLLRYGFIPTRRPVTRIHAPRDRKIPPAQFRREIPRPTTLDGPLCENRIKWYETEESA